MVTSFLNLIFTYVPIMNNSGKFKEISSTSFYCIIPTEANLRELINTTFFKIIRKPIVLEV